MEQLELNYCPFDHQETVHLDAHRFRIIVAGRRAGKTQLALQELIAHCLSTPKRLGWWVATTYRDAREIGWEGFMEHLDVLAPAVKKFNISQLMVEFYNGSKMYFKGSDKPDSLRGRGITFAVIDEAAFCHEDTWKKVIRPALSDKRGKAILISSPNGRNWFYEQYEYARSKHVKGWDAWRWPSSVNPLLSDEDIEAARHELSDQDFRQEYLAEFVTRGGMVYDEFDDDSIVESWTYDKEIHDIFLGMDFGYANPSAIVFMAVNRSSNYVVQFDEIYLARTPMAELVIKILQVLRKHNCPMPKAIFSDPAGNAEELSSGISPVDFLRENGFTVVNKGGRILPGLALVRSYIKNAIGVRRYKVTENCKESIRSLRGYTYKTHMNRPTEDPDKDNLHDHACDAIRYFFVNKFDSSKYVAGEFEQYSYVASKKKGTIIKRCCKCKMVFPSKTPRNQPPLICTQCSQEELNA